METPIKPSAKPAADEREKLKTDAKILAGAQQELMKHSWDTFVADAPLPGLRGSVVPGCPACRKILYTDHQYLSHLALDVLPQILNRILQNPD